MKILRNALAAAVVAVVALGASVVADEPGFKVYKKGEPVEFKGKKYVNIYQNMRYLGISSDKRDDCRVYDGAAKAGTMLCKVGDIKTAILSWDEQAPDKFKNKPTKYVLFFVDDGPTGTPGADLAVIAGEEEDKRFFAQGFANNKFAIEVPVKEGAPKQIVDMNSPMQWVKCLGFAVYSNGEWMPTPVRLAEKSYGDKEVTDADYDKNAITLPENYEFAK